MPINAQYGDPARKIAVRKAVFAHFKSRGIPDTKLDKMWYRWIKQKGWRIPCD